MNTFQCNNGSVVELDWGDDDEMTVWTTTSPREKIGNFTFLYVEGPDDRGDGDHYLVTNMFLEGPNGSRVFLNQGIGREIIKQVGELTPITFSPDDGIRRNEGSHLTGMGSGFARKMVQEGLATWED